MSESKTIWKGTASSDNPKASKPYVTVLTLDSDFDKNEFDEGQKDGEKEAKEGKPMCPNLNFPVSPYARGYYESYNSAKKTT